MRNLVGARQRGMALKLSYGLVFALFRPVLAMDLAKTGRARRLGGQVYGHL